MQNIDNLYTEAGIQDSLLQSNRSIQITMQSIFIAIGTGLSISIILTTTFLESLLLFCVFITIFTLAIYALIRIRKVILSRGLDVDYWHNKIIEAEKNINSEEKYLTRFKIYQKFHRKNIDETEFKNIELKDEILNKLTEKGKGHTRRIIDNYLFYGFLFTWLIFLGVTIIKLLITIRFL